MKRQSYTPMLLLAACVSLMLLVAPAAHAQTNERFISATEEEILNEINLARTNPQQYATYLEQWRRNYVGNRVQISGRAAFVTIEGSRAVDEAISFLRAAQPLPPLQVARGMCQGARDHLRDLEPRGTLDHTGSDGSTVPARVNRYGRWRNGISENLNFQRGSAREMVIDWIIDDGVDGRPHRANIFDPRFRIAGIALGNRGAQGAMCVMKFTGEFTEGAAAAATLGGAIRYSPAPAATAAPATNTTNGPRTAPPTATRATRQPR